MSKATVKLSYADMKAIKHALQRGVVMKQSILEANEGYEHSEEVIGLLKQSKKDIEHENKLIQLMDDTAKALVGDVSGT